MSQRVEPTFRTEQYRWLIRRVTIDLMAIDDDVQEIGTLLQTCGESAALAVEIRDAAKEDLETSKAEAADQLRKTIGDNGKPRSETTIDSMIMLNPNVRTKLLELQNARLDAALWQSLMSTLQNKSYAIRTAADMITSGFITRDYILGKRRDELANARNKVQV